MSLAELRQPAHSICIFSFPCSGAGSKACRCCSTWLSGTSFWTMVQPYLEPMIRGKSAIVSCWDLFQVCLQRLLFQVLYQALHALRKSAHPAL